MTEDERNKIRDLSKCDFSEMSEFFKKVTEDRKNRWVWSTSNSLNKKHP